MAVVEEWRPVLGFVGQYEVSNFGRVRSLTRPVRGRSHGQEFLRSSPGRLLRPGRCKDGHVTVSIGRRNSRLVHQLVLEAFVGPRPPYLEVLHLNGVPDDNRLENLKYGTRSENIKMDYASGVRQLSEEKRAAMFAVRRAHGFQRKSKQCL